MKKTILIFYTLTILLWPIKIAHAQTNTPIPSPTLTPIPDQRGDCCGPNALCAQGACSIDVATGQGVCTTTCVTIRGSNPQFTIPDYNMVGASQFRFNGQGSMSDVAGVISSFLPYIYILVGLLLLFYLLYGAFTWLTSMGNPSGIAAGSTIITRALIGFTIFFASFWIVQILEIIWGLDII